MYIENRYKHSTDLHKDGEESEKTIINYRHFTVFANLIINELRLRKL